MENISSVIFRAYDIRGIVGETLTAEVMYALGLAIGTENRKIGEKNIAIGRDGRLSAPLLLPTLIQGLQETGCKVYDIGAWPTPVLYFTTVTTGIKSGVMLTGSHNPANYNGLKIVINQQTFAGDKIQGLYHRILQKDFQYGLGSYQQLEIADNYLQCICEDVKLKRPLKIVVDCGNGIAGQLVPTLFRRLGCQIIELYCEVDGNFPYHHPDPSNPDNLQELISQVKIEQADLGLAFDGDGDRLGVVTNLGEIIWPDRQLMLYAQDVLSRNPEATIIYDVKSTYQLAQFIQNNGGTPLMWKTGHSFMKAKLAETGALLAGEMSGHFFFKERWFGFDDALYTAARLLEINAAQEGSLSDLFKTLPDSVSTLELKLPIAEEEKFVFMERFKQEVNFPDARIITLDGLRAEFEDGWGLIRPSNTLPTLILRFDACNQASLLRIQAIFRQALLDYQHDLILPF